MVGNEELMQCLIDYGRGTPQDFVTRSHNINDIIEYLRAECELEILKLTSFVTKNMISFERKGGSEDRSHQIPRADTKEDGSDLSLQD